MKREYKTKETKLKNADTLISMGDKFYWTPQILIFGYFINLEKLSNFDLLYFMLIIILGFIFVYLGVLMKFKGLDIYEEVYNSN